MDDVRSVFLSRIAHCRREDTHECALISARMGWLINIQAGLIISFFIASLSKDLAFVFYTSVFLFLIAAFFAYTITHAIRKAEIMIYEWHTREKQIYKEIQELRDSDLVRELSGYFLAHLWETNEKEDKKSSDAFSFQKFVFPALIIFWTAVLLLTAHNFIDYKTSISL